MDRSEIEPLQIEDQSRSRTKGSRYVHGLNTRPAIPFRLPHRHVGNGPNRLRPGELVGKWEALSAEEPGLLIEHAYKFSNRADQPVVFSLKTVKMRQSIRDFRMNDKRVIR